MANQIDFEVLGKKVVEEKLYINFLEQELEEASAVEDFERVENIECQIEYYLEDELSLEEIGRTWTWIVNRQAK